VFIPSRIQGQAVTTIGYEAFREKQLTNVTIPNNVNMIERVAFYDNQLASVTIPNSVTYIGYGAFIDNQLVSITIGANVNISEPESDGSRFPAFDNDFDTAYINNGKQAGTYTLNNGAWSLFAFENGTITGYNGKSAAVVIPSQIHGQAVTKIGYGAFTNKELTSVTIPDGVTEIGDMAFGYTPIDGYDFKGNFLTSVTIPNSVTTIGSYAFYHNELTSVVIPNSVTSIGEGAFNSNQLTSVTIPDNFTFIAAGTFSGNQLTSVVIPNSVTQIHNGAFSGNRLTGVVIHNRVTAIEGYAFADNPLTSITIGANVDLGGYAISGLGVNGPAFSEAFDNYYNKNGKKAGEYTLHNGVWSYSG